MTNTGIDYEIITQNIFNQILNQDKVHTISVQHDVILQGKTIEHQIDVFWEFEVGGIDYSTIIQAKDWESRVNQGELLKFKSVLEDLPNQPKGIFVTSTGYQKGAKEFAEKNGILLYELREPTEKDWKNRLKTIIINVNFFIPDLQDFKLEYDKEWAIKERKKLNIPKDEEFNFDFSSENMKFYDDKGHEINSLLKIISLLTPNSEMASKKINYSFNTPTFVLTDTAKFPRLKLNSIELTLSVQKMNQKMKLEAESIVGFILKNITKDKEIIFDKKFKIMNENKF